MDIPILGAFAIDAIWFAGIVIVIIAVIGYRMWKSKTALARLAKGLGMELGREGSAQVITGTYLEYPVNMEWSKRHEDGKKETNISITMRPCSFRLGITKEESLMKVGEHIETESIPTGDDHFDSEFAVRCGSREKAKRVVSEVVRASVTAAGNALREGESIVADNDHVTLKLENRHMIKAESIRLLLNALASVANSIQGSQVRSAPQAPAAPAAPKIPALPTTPAPPATTPTQPTTPTTPGE